mmetsp:Transcript_106095/g.167552  ORF Transcript_106095/g.167552 Transcript_106095/m.167552 type:complete len:97 (-) Transcript_106095:59-349(-)
MEAEAVVAVTEIETEIKIETEIVNAVARVVGQGQEIANAVARAVETVAVLEVVIAAARGIALAIVVDEELTQISELMNQDSRPDGREMNQDAVLYA